MGWVALPAHHWFIGRTSAFQAEEKGSIPLWCFAGPNTAGAVFLRAFRDLVYADLGRIILSPERVCLQFSVGESPATWRHSSVGRVLG